MSTLPKKDTDKIKCECGGELEEIEIPGTVLDPFAGSGTVGEFCRHNDRNAILFELNPEYKKLIEDRAMLLIPELSEWCSSKGDA
jgi:hypothetical protein